MKFNLLKTRLFKNWQQMEGSTFILGMAVASSLCMVVSLAAAAFFGDPLPTYVFLWASANLLLGLLGAFIVRDRSPQSFLNLIVLFSMGFSNLLLICVLPAMRT